MNTNFVPKKGIASQHGGDDHCNDAFSFLPFRKENGANSEAAKRKNKTSGALRNTHTRAVAEKEKTQTDRRRQTFRKGHRKATYGVVQRRGSRFHDRPQNA